MTFHEIGHGSIQSKSHLVIHKRFTLFFWKLWVWQVVTHCNLALNKITNVTLSMSTIKWLPLPYTFFLCKINKCDIAYVDVIKDWSNNSLSLSIVRLNMDSRSLTNRITICYGRKISKILRDGHCWPRKLYAVRDHTNRDSYGGGFHVVLLVGFTVHNSLTLGCLRGFYFIHLFFSRKNL